jgi:chromosome segregation and condensation protein ScpB
MKPRGDKRPTWTSLVEAALVTADDFMSVEQLMAVTGGTVNQVTAALHHLQLHHAAEVVEGGGRLWWFATPSTDTRSRVVEERRPEKPGTRRRRVRRST